MKISYIRVLSHCLHLNGFDIYGSIIISNGEVFIKEEHEGSFDDYIKNWLMIDILKYQNIFKELFLPLFIQLAVEY